FEQHTRRAARDRYDDEGGRLAFRVVADERDVLSIRRRANPSVPHTCAKDLFRLASSDLTFHEHSLPAARFLVADEASVGRPLGIASTRPRVAPYDRRRPAGLDVDEVDALSTS